MQGINITDDPLVKSVEDPSDRVPTNPDPKPLVIEEEKREGNDPSQDEGDHQPSNDNAQIRKKPGNRKVKSLQDLVFVRLIDPVHIPTYLVKQIKDRLFDVERFYQHQKEMCLISSPRGTTINPYNYLYALVNEKIKQVKGVLWCVVDPLTESLVINNFSIDAEYWNRGESLQLLEKQVKNIRRELRLKRIVWITKNVKFCKAKGYKESKFGFMIYEGE